MPLTPRPLISRSPFSAKWCDHVTHNQYTLCIVPPPHRWLLWRIFLQWVSLPGSWGSISRLLLAAILTKVNTWARTVALFFSRAVEMFNLIFRSALKTLGWAKSPSKTMGSELLPRWYYFFLALVELGVYLSIRLRFPLWYNHIQQARSRRYVASHNY